MAMPVEASDIARGDWSPTYGTVEEVKSHVSNGKITNITIKFFNGKSIMVKPDAVIEIEQDGADIVHDGMPDASQIRPGLAADHAKD